MSFDLKYGSYSFTGLPVPNISLDTSFDTTSAGAIIGSTVKVSIRGLIYATGNLNDNTNYSVTTPPETGTAFTVLLSHMTGLRKAFSKDYQELSLTCNNTKILPDNLKPNSTKVNSISFSRNGSDQNMLRTAEYSIDLSVEATGNFGTYGPVDNKEFYVSSIENSYTIESTDTLNYYGHTSSTQKMYPQLSATYLPTYRITRTLGANGKATSGVGAVANAKKCVSGLISHDINFTNIINNLTVFERSTSIESSEIDGKYSITDNFTAISGAPINPWTETFTINHNMDDSFKRTITINGTIQGLGSGWSTSWQNFADNTTGTSFFPVYQTPSVSKYLCASGGYSAIKSQIFNRAFSVAFPSGSGSTPGQLYYNSSRFPFYTGSINPIPLSISVDHDFNNGSITYNYTYDTRPLNLVSGSLSENLSVEDSYSTRSYATMPIISRRPIFQDLGTYSLPSRTVTYDATFPSLIRFVSGEGIPNTINNQISGVLYSFDPGSYRGLMLPNNVLGGVMGIISYLIKDDVNIDIISGKYSRSITWNYEKKRT